MIVTDYQCKIRTFTIFYLLFTQSLWKCHFTSYYLLWGQWSRDFLDKRTSYLDQQTKIQEILYATRNDPRPQMTPKIDLNTTRNDPRPQIFSHAIWNDPWGITGVEWENICISGIRLKRFNPVFRLMRSATFFGYKREIFSKWLVDCTKLFWVILIAWNLLFRSLFRWTFYREISRIQQCRGPRGLQLILFCYLKSVTSGNEDKPPDANSCMQKLAEVSYQQ